ncbi:hypothetical protein [Citrobacter koseri]|uniref:hypothetical protein n=1 Tax=Citrobacter koseri TaxID=545 RepID=UPI002941C6C8|nr:hypothetical protein [Citrobacter koseri]MEB2702208.1 hypothetical protein [Citrobacter koseri]MEB2708647.1 hypothetical protein [Citrobacter koseri]MEB2771109.1 hypothetical protein [Citrobacter koseri]WOJ27593.1 hypothetical protein R1221_07100 [Citrobacter koseri]
MSKPTYEYLEAQVKQLEADNEKAMSVLKEANDAVLLAKSKFDALAAENAGLKKALSSIANAEEFHGDTLVCDFQTLVTTAWLALKETSATDAFLAEVRASAIKSALDDCSEYLDRDCIMESNGISYDDAALREIGAMALQEALLHKGAAQ